MELGVAHDGRVVAVAGGVGDIVIGDGVALRVRARRVNDGSDDDARAAALFELGH